MTPSSRPVFVLRLEARPGTDPIRALRSLLKIAGRQFHLRCVDAYEIKPQPERTREHGTIPLCDRTQPAQRRRRLPASQGWNYQKSR